MIKSMVKMFPGMFLVSIIGLMGVCKNLSGQEQPLADNMIKLGEWQRFIKFESPSDSNLFAFIWFYEWNMFGAVKKGEHTHGIYDWKWRIDEDNESALMDGGWIKLNIHSAENGADLLLEITNRSDHDWPDIAAIIPCFNPGHLNNTSEENTLFLDEEHIHTYFYGEDGLELLAGEFPREIHFNNEYYTQVMDWEKERQDGKFVFGEKWPTSPRNAYKGIIIRESTDKRYVMGIAWDNFLSAQGHNPLYCIHLSVNVGPLARNRARRSGVKSTCLKARRRIV